MWMSQSKYGYLQIHVWIILTFTCRMKVDLTKYIEQHNFTFDDVFDSNETNERVNV